jgi:arginyl-tRNA synthetase
LAREFIALPKGADLLSLPEEEAVAKASAWGGARILGGIKDDLAAMRVNFDNWYSERSLVEKGAVQAALEELRAQDLIYDSEGAVWFKASALGDEKDRVVVRSNGEITYFASDIAYHLEKYQRGFDRLVDVWGADHHGYVPRLKAAMGASGRDPETFQVVLVQMVNLLRGGQPVSMSTRGGEFVTLREVYEEVGVDSARFLFLTRRSEAPLDFDLEVAKAQSMDNPVYYVQYAHTRVKSVLRKAGEAGISPPAPEQADLSRLSLKEEVDLARRLAEFPEVATSAARSLEPHRLPYYLGQLAGQFHSYYHKEKVLVDDPALAGARLLLITAVGQVLALGLELLGVSAPEVM